MYGNCITYMFQHILSICRRTVALWDACWTKVRTLIFPLVLNFEVFMHVPSIFPYKVQYFSLSPYLIKRTQLAYSYISFPNDTAAWYNRHKSKIWEICVALILSQSWKFFAVFKNANQFSFSCQLVSHLLKRNVYIFFSTKIYFVNIVLHLWLSM